MILAYAGIFGLVQIIVSIAALHYGREKDRRHEQQVNNLLDRIQAPEQAVAASLTPDDAELVPAVGFDDDEAYWDKQERLWRARHKLTKDTD